MTTQTLQKIGFQHVGSFLRPEALKQARQSFAAGNITAEELEGVENSAITELVNKEVEAGLDVVTDGEFRRSYWHLDNFWDLKVSNVLTTVRVISLHMKKHVMIQLV